MEKIKYFKAHRIWQPRRNLSALFRFCCERIERAIRERQTIDDLWVRDQIERGEVEKRQQFFSCGDIIWDQRGGKDTKSESQGTKNCEFLSASETWDDGRQEAEDTSACVCWLGGGGYFYIYSVASVCVWVYVAADSPSQGRGDGGRMRQHDRKVIKFAWVPEAFARHGISAHGNAHVCYLHVICQCKMTVSQIDSSTWKCNIFWNSHSIFITIEKVNIFAGSTLAFPILKIAAYREGVQ